MSVQANPAAGRTDSGASHGRTVLVVDDQPDAADALAAVLTELGHSVRRAYDGRTALLIAAQQCPQVIFLDIMMPRMDGFEVARALREIPGLERATLVAVTGHGDEELRELARNSGFQGYLVKPPTLGGLLPMLSQ